MRTFLALPLGPAEVVAVGELVARTLVEARRELRFTRPTGMHLTLAFLGEVTEERVERLARALPVHAGALAAPELELDRCGAFPDARRARVLWVGVRERAQPGRLDAVRAAVLVAVRETGIPPPADADEPYRPHVTVARARGRPSALPAAFAEARPALPWGPAEVVLFESLLAPGGSRHEPRARVPFSTTGR